MPNKKYCVEVDCEGMPGCGCLKPLIAHETTPYKCVEVSCTHGTLKDSTTLIKIAKGMSEDAERVLTSTESIYIKLFEEHKAFTCLSIALNVLLEAAHSQGFELVELNSRAPVISGFDVFDW